MSDNRTADEYKFSKQIGTIGHCFAAQIFKNGKAFLLIEPTENEADATYTAGLITDFLNGNISQQTASLREEVEELKKSSGDPNASLYRLYLEQFKSRTESAVRHFTNLIAGLEKSYEREKQLQEEVERLTGWLIDVDKDFNCLTDSQRKALSSKESKQDL